MLFYVTTADDVLTVEPPVGECTDEQFACQDGGCIDIQRRCDSTYDCLDASDELHCGQRLISPQSNLTQVSSYPDVIPTQNCHCCGDIWIPIQYVVSLAHTSTPMPVRDWFSRI